MNRKLRFIIVFLVLFLAALTVIPAQQQANEPSFFVGLIAEALWYGIDAPAFGGGLIIGGGTGISIGGRVLYAAEANSISVLELGIFIRSYMDGKDAIDGLFIQFNAGMAIIDQSFPSLPANKGSFTAGIEAGWRILLGGFYIDPVIRAGYPYMVGMGVSAGFRF